MEDPNWLLSSAAQSAAALVAIVGGFLVSRLLALTAIRHELELQIEEAESRLSLARGGEGAARLQMREQFALDTLMASAADIAAGKALEDADGLDDLADELGEYWTWALSAATSEPSEPELPSPFELFDADQLVAKIRQERADSARQAKAPRGVFDIPIPRGPFRTGEEWELRRLSIDMRDREVEREIAEHSGVVAATTRDLDRLRPRLAAVRDVPREVSWGFWTLAYFALAGVLIPMGVLATQPTKLGSMASWGVWGLFVSGLIAVLVYIRVLISRLGHGGTH